MQFLKQYCIILLISSIIGTITMAQDTLMIDVNAGGINIDMTEVIQGDTLANGDRVNPSRVYKLKAGGRYVLSGPITNTGYHLEIVGEASSETVAPPIIMRQVDINGDSPDFIFYAQGDLTLKNVYMLNVDVNGTVRNVISAQADSIDLTMDNVIWDYCRTVSALWGSLDADIKITNCYIRNGANHTNTFPWMRFLGTGKIHVDTVIYTNNTFLNMGMSVFETANKSVDVGANYVLFEHNSVINSYKQVFHCAFWREAHIKNNLFFNPISCGDAILNRNQDSDLNEFAIVWIDSINAPEVIAESDRIIDISNNNYFYQGEIKNQLINDTLTNPVRFLNERDSLMDADDATWPGITVDWATITEEDPGFNSTPYNIDSLLVFAEGRREPTWPASVDITWDADGDGDPTTIGWPITEDLSYTNANLLTASTDGLPLGDLYRWFPDKYNDYFTDVENNINSEVPVSYTLNQNYPNPFNPTTIINFNLPEKAEVELSIYNVLGQKITTLVNSKLSAGNHSVQLDASNLSSGIYFYTLRSNTVTLTKKMMLLK